MIKRTSSWNDEFFEDFYQYRNSLYKNNKYYIEENLEDFKEFLSAESAFNQNNTWVALLVYSTDGKVLGRVFASTRTDEYKQNKFLPFGFFEATDEAITKLLMDEVEAFAREQGFKNIRGPIQGNVFHSSRLLIRQNKKPFYGEPLLTKSYHEYLLSAGFYQSQSWVSGYFGVKGRILGMTKYLSRFSKSKSRKANYKIRQMDFQNWESEFKLVYNLLMESFSSLDDVEKLTFEEFKVWNEGLKYIVQPKNCLILEYQDEALGFIIAYHDLLPEIRAMKKSNNIFNQLRFLIRKYLFRRTLLVNYLGKKEKCEGKVKGVAPKLFAKLAKNNYGFLFSSVIFGFVSEHSKTLEIVPKVYEESSEYIMLEKSIT